jgi:hypothetical protein
MIHSPRTTPRSEYLQQEKLRVDGSAVLAEKYPKLHTLTVDLGYYSEEGIARSSQVKYTVNLEHAKSIFRVGCHNQECVRGDFDLTEVIAAAVAARKTSVSGELCCQGWRNRAGIDTIPCRNLLRYKLTLGYTT